MVKQSTYTYVTIGGILIAALLLIAVIFINKGFGPGSESAARAAVTHFGTQMQQVSLLSPEASSTLRTVYGDLVTPELLQAWQEDPEHAPGRLTSSPYPAGIKILSSAKQGSGFIFNAEVDMETSDGSADPEPVLIFAVPQNGKWLIAAYQSKATSTGE